MPNDTPATVREILEQPFPQESIKTRPGSHGQALSYVETHNYIARLNGAYNGSWSFEITSHQIDEDEVIVVGKLITPDCTKMAFGSANITRKKDTREIIDLGDTMKAAASDSLKKACSLLGIGLHMYGDVQGENSTPKNSDNGNGDAKTNGNGEDKSRLSSKQLGMILALGRERGISREKLKDMAQERYGRTLEFLTRSEASFFIGELQEAA